MLKGQAWKYGDDIDTDVIIPARFLTTTDPAALKTHALADLDPSFAATVQPGDLIVAGKNFGCGSSREHAPVALKAAGVSGVIATSFARIFFRNAINIGLPILESPEAVAGTSAGDELEVDLVGGRIKNLTNGAEFVAAPVPEFMQALIADGGLLESVKKRLAAGLIKAQAAEAAAGAAAETAAKPRGARMKELEKESEPAGLTAPWVEEAAESAEAAPATKTAAEKLEEDEEEEAEE